MKVTSVELQPAGSSTVCVLSFRDPGRQNPYNVVSIAGLDADNLISRFYRGSGSSARFYNPTQEKREPVFNISLNPDYAANQTYSSLRDVLYKLISSSRTGLVEVRFKNGATTVAVLSGLVSKFENTLFEKNPGVQITLVCDDTMLRAPTPVVVNVAGLDEANTVINDDLSTAPHGFSFTMTMSAVDAFRMTDPSDDSWEFVVTPVGGFLVSDVLHFSSEHNDKYLYLVRAGVTIHLADVIGSGSVWPILFPGVNTFALDDPTLMAWASIQYRPTYWGV